MASDRENKTSSNQTDLALMSSPDPSAALNDTSLTAIHSCGSTYIVYQDASLHLHAHCVEGDIEHSGGDVWPTPPKARELTPLAFLQWGSGSEYNIASGLAPQISLADGLVSARVLSDTDKYFYDLEC